MNILITGGTGFFGRALLDYISVQQRSYIDLSVTVISRSPKLFLAKYPRFKDLSWLKIIKGDILVKKSLPKDCEFSHIIHAATESTLSSSISYKNQYFDIIDGTRNILDLTRQNKKTRLLYISSGAVYGNHGACLDPLKEESTCNHLPLNSENAYGMGKLASEHMCALYHHTFGLDYTVARCFSFIGPGLPLNAHYAVGNFINDALNSRDIVIKGNGKAIRSYLDQRDLAHWLFTLLSKGKQAEVCNVGSDLAINIKDLANMIIKEIRPSLSIKILNESVSNNTSRQQYIPNIEKVQTEYGLSVTIPLEESIRYTARFHAYR